MLNRDWIGRQSDPHDIYHSAFIQEVTRALTDTGAQWHMHRITMSVNR